MGIVSEIGKNVKKVKVGEKVGVAPHVGSCGKCKSCVNEVENFCPKLIIPYGTPYHDGTICYGGFSNETVRDERFVFRFPENLSLPGGAPLVSAGVTTYGALRNNGLDKPGLHVGVVGLGGLGHLAVKFAKALGVKVTVISTNPSKEHDAINGFGADAFILTHHEEQMKVSASYFNCFIFKTLNVYKQSLKNLYF